MTDPKPNDKVEEEEKPKRKKPPGWRNFQRVLKQVISMKKPISLRPSAELSENPQTHRDGVPTVVGS